MSDADKAASKRPGNTHEAEYSITPDFQAAVAEAGRLLEHAVSAGLVPEQGPNAQQSAEALVRDVVAAQEATRAGRLNSQIVIAFWIAYGRLARMVDPVTAASLGASKQISLVGMKIRSAFLVAAIILFSIFLFMSNATLNDTYELIDQQNTAALKLWSDIQLLRTSGGAAHDGVAGGGPTLQAAVITEREFEEMVEFSRRSAWLLQSASRLNFWFTPPWLKLSINDVTFPKDGPAHLNVPPDLLPTADAIELEAVNQIKAYQNIRDYALGLYKIDTLIYSSLSTYLLPTVYAVLGAFLYGFRFYSRLIRRKEYLPSAAHSARYYIAAIAGLVVGLFGSLLPKSLSLPPLAVAFLVGYAVEAFFSRLDDLIRKFKVADAPASASPNAGVAAGSD